MGFRVWGLGNGVYGFRGWAPSNGFGPSVANLVWTLTFRDSGLGFQGFGIRMSELRA